MSELEKNMEEYGHPGGLIGAILQKSLNDAHTISQSLIDSYRDQAETAEATLDAIRATVDALFDGPYMPTPDAVLRALYPSPDVIDSFRRERFAE